MNVTYTAVGYVTCTNNRISTKYLFSALLNVARFLKKEFFIAQQSYNSVVATIANHSSDNSVVVFMCLWPAYALFTAGTGGFCLKWFSRGFP